MLIIQRVANKSALTANDVVHGSISEFKAKSRGESADGGSFPSGDSMTGSTGECGKNPGELEVRADVETTDISTRIRSKSLLNLTRSDWTSGSTHYRILSSPSRFIYLIMTSPDLGLFIHYRMCNLY